jgi:hypothetical protein
VARLGVIGVSTGTRHKPGPSSGIEWERARTVGAHVEHIDAKIDVNTRGAAAMFAMRHGLIG